MPVSVVNNNTGSSASISYLAAPLVFYFTDLFSLLSFHPGFGQVSEGNV